MKINVPYTWTSDNERAHNYTLKCLYATYTIIKHVYTDMFENSLETTRG